MKDMIRGRKQREQVVIELYSQGKTFREIAKATHMSFRDIGKVTRMASGEYDNGPGSLCTNGKSIDSQALELFSQGKRPIDVTIALDVKVQDVERLYKDFLRLSGLGKLASLYDEFKDSLPSFLKLYDNLTRERKLNNKEIESIMNCSREFPWIKIKYQKLLSDIDELENKKMVHLTELRTLQETLFDLEREVEQPKHDFFAHENL